MAERTPTSAPQIFVITGASGAGKDTIVNHLLTHSPEQYSRLVTCTDRPPRPGETDGVDYHFLTPAQFQESFKAGEMIEHQPYGSTYKGFRREDLMNALADQRTTLIRIDMGRAAEWGEFINEKFPPEEAQIIKNNSTVILIGTEQLSTQMRRATSRGLPKEEYRRRMRENDWVVWEKHSERFKQNGKDPNGVRYHLFYNEDPEEGQTVEEKTASVAAEIHQLVYQATE